MRSVKVISVLLGVVFLTASAFGQQSKRDEGIDLYRAGNFAESVSRLTEATAVDKMDRHAWLYLAAAYKHLGKDKEATKAFERSQTAKKTDPQTYEKPAKITSKRTAGIKGDDSSPPSDYAVAVELRADGTVGIIIPYMKAFLERRQAIVDAAKKIKFEPAEQSGKPVTVIHVIDYIFSSN